MVAFAAAAAALAEYGGSPAARGRLEGKLNRYLFFGFAGRERAVAARSNVQEK